MYALKRMAAYAIDFFLVFTPIAAFIAYGENAFAGRVSPRLYMIAATGSWGFSILGPILINGISTGLTGRTLGKLIMFLNVKDGGGDPPGIAQGILRELVKAVAVGFFLGIIWALHGLLTRGRTFYDEWLDLDVDDLAPYGLTETQKNWRKYHREQARRKGR
jgi:uncharacterized RDD family membrane protein YckC